jgi:hypothetical protein
MNEEIMNPDTTGLTVNESMKADLLSAARWTKFLCIIGCIGMGLMVLVAILMFFLGSTIARAANAYPLMPLGGGLGFIYLIVTAIYIYPIIKGFQFANGTKAACLTGSEAQLARGFAGMRSYLKFTGILTIIVLVIYLIMGIVAGIGFLAMQNGAQ